MNEPLLMIQEEAMAAKLKKKAALQKKATTSRKYVEGFKGEQEKQDEMKQKTKKEKRDMMCEELGRGC
jgi:hypothetical protein